MATTYAGFHDHSTHPEAFPRLTPEQVARVEAIGERRCFLDGGALFEQGERDFGFFVLAEGRVRVVQRGASGDVVFAKHDAGEFTGDMAMLTRQPAIGAAISEGKSEVIWLDAKGLKRVVAEDAELGEIILGAYILRRSILQSSGYAFVQLIGSRWSPQTFAIKDFLARHRVMYKWIDPEYCSETEAVLTNLGVTPSELPVVALHHLGVLRQPSLEALGEALGLRATLVENTYDLVVVGAGPGGLASAVYGASEGLNTLVLDASAPGGQAGLSSKIENFLGFPLGLSGTDLAERAVLQAQKFGAVLSSPSRVTSLECNGEYKHLTLDTGDEVMSKAVVMATGARYRKLPAKGGEPFEGMGIYYGATATEAALCRDGDVIVVGGGNSAGQAAVFLSGHCRRVRIVIRGESLRSSMSRYLIDRIERAENIELVPFTEITAFHGNGHLDAVTIKSKDGAASKEPIAAVFVMIGADPCTDWTGGCVGLDAKGFVPTGADAQANAAYGDHWTRSRTPFYLESTRPGIFAVGDVRANSIKRVASAVGEGSMAVKYAHEVLAE